MLRAYAGRLVLPVHARLLPSFDYGHLDFIVLGLLVVGEVLATAVLASVGQGWGFLRLSFRLLGALFSHLG